MIIRFTIMLPVLGTFVKRIIICSAEPNSY